MYRHLDALKSIKSTYCFLLFSEEGYLLSIKYKPGIDERWYEFKDFFKPGVSFNEESIGTNSVSLAMLLRQAICCQSEFHYCSKLKFWNDYCVPIVCTGSITGYIAVVSIYHPISNALKGFADLLVINLYGDESSKTCKKYSCDIVPTELSSRQNLILRMLAQGFSDEQISHELELSLATVKYHNQIIFKKLNASTRVDAVVKAIIYNKLTFYDLYSLYA